MYIVQIQITDKKTGKIEEVRQTTLGEPGTAAYEEMAEALSDEFYELDILYDDVDSGGDMVIDDILISIAEGEAFEERLVGRKKIYTLKGTP